MKKVFPWVVLLLITLFASTANAEGNAAWDDAPVITAAYEISANKLYLEWEGGSQLYQIQMDGKRVMDVGQPKAVITIKKGTHSIVVWPTVSEKAGTQPISGKIDGVGSIELDLSALGIGVQDLKFGNASEPLYVDYNPNPILDAVPDRLEAVTVQGNNVQLSFMDRYASDAYLITVKSGKDINYIQFNAAGNPSDFVCRDKSVASVILDQGYLSENHCIIPELGENYQFRVQLRKNAVNLVNNEPIREIMLESKESKWLKYTPVAAWKTPPAITYASQTADGQVKIIWEHESYGTGIEYLIVRDKKTLMLRTGEEVLGKTGEHEMVINDLTNGKHGFSVVPTYQGERGPRSDTVDVEIKNEWVTAAYLVCEQLEDHQIRLTWTAPENIEKYHITVSEGDVGSMLRFVNLDYKEIFEEEIDAVAAGPIEYIYSYDALMDDAPVRLKFEIYGIHYAQSGQEQRSALSKVTIVAE